MITVRELIWKLTELEDNQLDQPIVLAKDREGNSFSPVDDFSLGKYAQESTWSGDFIDHPEDVDDAPDDAVDAVCLWPVN